MQETHTEYYETMYDSFVQNDLRGKPLLLARYTPTDPHQRSRQRSRVIRNLVAVDEMMCWTRTASSTSERVRATRHEVAAHIMKDCALVKLKDQHLLINSLLPPTPTISTHEAMLVNDVHHQYYHDPLCPRYPLLDPATTFRPINDVAFKSAEHEGVRCIKGILSEI